MVWPMGVQAWLSRTARTGHSEQSSAANPGPGSPARGAPQRPLSGGERAGRWSSYKECPLQETVTVGGILRPLESAVDGTLGRSLDMP